MEDALALVTSLAQIDDLEEALAAFESSRRPVVHKIVTAANTSGDWYETFAERMNAPPLDFAFDYITRSGRVDTERLREARAPVHGALRSGEGQPKRAR